MTSTPRRLAAPILNVNRIAADATTRTTENHPVVGKVREIGTQTEKEATNQTIEIDADATTTDTMTADTATDMPPIKAMDALTATGGTGTEIETETETTVTVSATGIGTGIGTETAAGMIRIATEIAIEATVIVIGIGTEIGMTAVTVTEAARRRVSPWTT
jgi:hypothetical protein